MYDFANLLFSGPCNARCYFCIGQQVEARLRPDNLDIFPPRNLETLIDLIGQHGIRQVVFTGTNTDPQRYRHESRLLALLRRRLPPNVQFSLHTNGLLALRKLEIFNQYDRVTLSFPSFDPAVYQAMMGLPRPPDLAAILEKASPPVKISCLLDAHNLPGLPAFLARCQALSVRRLVLRKLYGDPRPWPALLDPAALGLAARSAYRGNPVYVYGDMEVTMWDFEQSTSRSLNLFASGHLSPHYLLTQATALVPAVI